MALARTKTASLAAYSSAKVTDLALVAAHDRIRVVFDPARDWMTGRADIEQMDDILPLMTLAR